MPSLTNSSSRSTNWSTGRYEYPHPGGLLHLDIKKLGRFRRPGNRVTGDQQQDSRGAGWEYVHVAIADHSRIAT